MRIGVLILALPVFVLLMALPSAVRAEGTTFEELVAQLGWKTLVVEFDFTVQREGKSPLEKGMKVFLSDDGGNQNMLARFTYPANMKGTAFLANTTKERQDEYHLYLRTLRRVKRVPSSTENFMLRDFLSLYLMKPRPEMWNVRSLPQQNRKGNVVEVLECTARDSRTTELTGYGKLVHFVDPERKVIVATEFYGDGGKLVRRQEVLDFKLSSGVVLPARFKTEDLIEGVSATVDIKKLTMNAPLPEDIFTVRYLKQL